MKSILISEKDYQEFTPKQKEMYSEFILSIKYSKKLKPMEFLKNIGLSVSDSERWVFMSRCRKIASDSSGRYKENELRTLYDSNTDLRSQEKIMSDFQESGMYDVWTYFKKFRDKTVSMNAGLKYCKKLIKHETIAYGQKRVYPLSELEKLK